ncbi:MAG: NAD(P)-dependent oxidoreductase [Planctomycetota bacterium]
MKPKVLITERLDDRCAAWLAERCDVAWVAHDDLQALNAALPTAQGLVVRTYTQVDAALLAQAPQLKVVGRAGVGLDNFDLDACRAAGVRVVYTPDANTQAVVEYVTGLMLDHFRPRTTLPRHAEAETFHEMRSTEVGRQLDELTLGILGFGRIGKRLGAVAHAIGMNLLVCDLLPEPGLRQAVDYPFDYVSAAELYAGADVVSVHVDGRPSNWELIDAAALGAMRPGVLFVNAARGMLVDHDALAGWAAQNPGAQAILDVHAPEPPATDSPLHGQPNVQLLPHLASRTHTALENMSWVVRDVAAVLEGRTPRDAKI